MRQIHCLYCLPISSFIYTYFLIVTLFSCHPVSVLFFETATTFNTYTDSISPWMFHRMLCAHRHMYICLLLLCLKWTMDRESFRECEVMNFVAERSAIFYVSCDIMRFTCMYVCMYVCMYNGRAHWPLHRDLSSVLCFPFYSSPQKSCTSNEMQDLVRGGVEIVT
jgi:hypothetical protein